jgi:hypothetical protein
MIARLWLHDPSLAEYFEEVYYNDPIKIFKVLKPGKA